jgi:TnpA family transposase
LAVDTHGYTNAALAVGRLLKVDVLLRLKNLKERALYVPRGVDIPKELKDVVKPGVSLKAIEACWDELVRLVASIEAGFVTADVVLARFGSAAAAGDPFHRAADHLGRLLQTNFLCDYLAHEAFRREIHRILDHCESVHQLQRVIYYGLIPTRRGRRHEEALALSGSLTLLTNITRAWTTYRVQKSPPSLGFGAGCVSGQMRPGVDSVRKPGEERTYQLSRRLRLPCGALRAATGGGDRKQPATCALWSVASKPSGGT